MLASFPLHWGLYFSTSLFSFAQIYSRGELHHFIDGFNEEKSNWLRYVNPAHSAREQNLAACQNGMNIYFYTVKPIPANQELLVWYCRDFAERLHYPYPGELTMMNLSKWITEKKKLKMPVMSVLPLCTNNMLFNYMASFDGPSRWLKLSTGKRKTIFFSLYSIPYNET